VAAGSPPFAEELEHSSGELFRPFEHRHVTGVFEEDEARFRDGLLIACGERGRDEVIALAPDEQCRGLDRRQLAVKCAVVEELPARPVERHQSCA